MKFFVRSILMKAKKSPIGTVHKWHDGTYIKVGDHEWHKHPEQRFRILQLLKDTNQIMLSMGIKFKSPLHFEVKAREGKSKKWAAKYWSGSKSVSLETFGSDSKSIIHELGHAIDFAMHHEEGYRTRSEDLDEPEMDPTLRSKYKEMLKLVSSSPYYHSKHKPSFKTYLHIPTEVFARAFEVYGYVKVKELIAQKKISETYIQNYYPWIYRHATFDQQKEYDTKITECMDYILKHDKIRKALVTIGIDMVKAKKVPVGTHTKRADGSYVKQGEHDWHKEKTLVTSIEKPRLNYPTDVQHKNAVDAKAIGYISIPIKDFLRLTTDNSDFQTLTRQTHAIGGSHTIFPFLEFDAKTGQVTGHEGRHRAANMLKDGHEHIRIALYPEPKQRDWSPDMSEMPEKLTGQFDKNHTAPIKPKSIDPILQNIKGYPAWADFPLNLKKAWAFIFKAKKVPIGTRSKWADGIYVKKGDHKWHKEHLTKLAHALVEKENKKKDPQVKKEFTAIAHDFVRYLEENNWHPETIPTKDFNEYWAEAIGDENFHKNAGWQKYTKMVRDVVKEHHDKLTALGKDRHEASLKAKSKPLTEQMAKPKKAKVMEEFIDFQEGPKAELPPQTVNPPPAKEPDPIVPIDPEPPQKKGEFKPSPYQQKIFDWIKNGKGNGVIDAKAGSGKTATIVKALDLIPRDKSVIFLAFNTSARDELNERVPQWAVDQKAVRTLNSLGFAAWARQMGGYGQLKVDASKTANIIRETLEFEDQPYRYLVKDLVSKAKQAGLAPKMPGIDGLLPDRDSEWNQLINHFNIDASGLNVQKAIGLARVVLRKSIEEKRVIDFDDQFYMPIVHNSPWPKHDFMFVDECLPGSTNILLADGSEKSIKEIVDTRSPVEVLAWDTEVRQQRVCKVTGWSKTPNVKPCVKIEVKYTKKLPAVSSVGKPYLRTATFTRQVICTIDHKIWTENAGWVVAGRIEPGDIVQAETLAKANHKQKIGKSGRKNLSKEMSEKNKLGKCGYNKPQIPTSKQIAVLKGGNGSELTESQSFLLSQLGPEWVAEYPVPTEIPRGQGFPTCYKIDIANPSRKIAIEIDGRSHRLLARKKQDAKKDKLLRKLGWKVLRYSNEDAVRQHEKIRKLLCVGGNCPINATVISVEKYDFNEAFVYDLTVDDCHNFYANGILVHNCQDVSDIQREAISRAADSRTRVIAVGDKNQCIYGFRGANPESFDLLKKEFKAQTFDLPVSYRCAKKIIDSVKHLVPGIRARDDAPEGEVKDFGYQWDNKDFKQTDMIVCRNNAPLVSVAYKLLREKIPCKLMGRDIGSNITTLIKKWKPKSLKDLREEATRWSNNEIRIATARDPDADLTSIEDRYETIMTFLEETKADTVAGLVKEIEQMFAADDGNKSENILRLSTVHKAKGLEAPRVWLLNRDLMPHKMAKLAWQMQQEDNLIYVAHTRAKNSLYFIQKDMPRNLKKAIDALIEQRGGFHG